MARDADDKVRSLRIGLRCELDVTMLAVDALRDATETADDDAGSVRVFRGFSSSTGLATALLALAVELRGERVRLEVDAKGTF